MRTLGKSFCLWLVVCGFGVGIYSCIIHNVAGMYANAGYMLFGTFCWCVIVKFSAK